MRQYITCPKCLLDGRKKTIAELLPTGQLAIARQRSKWSYEESTIVEGNDLSLLCGYCRTKVFMRKEEDASSDFRIKWIHWITFSGSIIGQGISSGTNQPGTIVLSV